MIKDTFRAFFHDSFMDSSQDFFRIFCWISIKDSSRDFIWDFFIYFFPGFFMDFFRQYFFFRCHSRAFFRDFPWDSFVDSIRIFKGSSRNLSGISSVMPPGIPSSVSLSIPVGIFARIPSMNSFGESFLYLSRNSFQNYYTDYSRDYIKDFSRFLHRFSAGTRLEIIAEYLPGIPFFKDSFRDFSLDFFIESTRFFAQAYLPEFFQGFLSKGILPLFFI